MADPAPPASASLRDVTPGQFQLASWVRRHMSALCVDAIMAGHATAAEAQAVLAHWRHPIACPAWRGDPCTCEQGGTE